MMTQQNYLPVTTQINFINYEYDIEITSVFCVSNQMCLDAGQCKNNNKINYVQFI